MATLLLILVVVLVIAGLVYGVVTLISGDDPGLVPAEPDGRVRPLPNDRSLHEGDLKEVRFDLALRGYRMAQVDRVLRRTAYDLGYKDEMIAVLEAEVAALREGRVADAEVLRQAREEAANPASAPVGPSAPEAGEITVDVGPVADEEVAGTEHGADFSPERAAATEEVAAQTLGVAEETEPREGSLLRRNRPSDTSVPDAPAADGFAAGPVPADAVPTDAVPTGPVAVDAEQPALEVADRPAHA